MAEPLHESGICKGDTLTCSKHLWQWNILTGEQQGPAERPLLLYRSELRGDEVWAYIEEELTYDFDEDDDDDFEW
jgi:toluene monooxygenase system ferredoxin subunit